MSVEGRLDPNIKESVELPLKRTDSAQPDKMFQMYMQAPYKLMDRKRE